MEKAGGVYKTPCKVNGVALKFIFDTGASDVSISLTEAIFLFKNGYLVDEDVIGKVRFSDATGNVSVGTKLNIRKLEFSGITLYNVEASIVHELNAPLLLGQSAMAKLGKFQFDPIEGVLTILNNPVKVMDFGTKESRAFCDTGYSKQELKDYQGALIYYNKAIGLSPNSFVGYYHRGVLNSDIQNNAEAIMDLTRAIKLNPNFFMAYIYRGWIKEDIEDFKSAIADFTEAINIASQDNDYEDLATVFWCRGNSKKQLKDQQGAIEDYSKTIGLDPNYFIAYFNRGHSKMVLKEALTASPES